MLTDLAQFVELDTVNSTNSWLVDALRTGAVQCPCAVFAHEQTGGRGRAGRVWNSGPRGAGLSVSLAVAESTRVGAPAWGSWGPWVPLVVGVQVLAQLHQLGALSVGLKWPNDLMVGTRKLGGVLCERVLVDGQFYLVVGVGLNVRPPIGIEQAASLQGLGIWGARNSAVDLARRLVHQINGGLREVQALGSWQPFREQFHAHDVFLGQAVQVLDVGQQVCQGKALGVALSGGYEVQSDERVVEVQVGDLSLRKLER